jgi:HNH endonuclease
MPKRKPRYPHLVCKPCWELKYCPYGVMVEEFPIRPGHRSLADVTARFNEILEGFARGDFKTREEVSEMVQSFLYHVPENWEEFEGYDTTDIECNVFGHVCPVFLVAEGATETKTGRSVGSRYIPRDVMLKVVRRDGQMCQLCAKNVLDNELHLDHVIPVSRGGTSTVENLRVLCAECNLKKKSDSLDELLWDRQSKGAE